MTAEEVKRLVSILEKIVDTKIQKYALRENHLSPIAFEEKNMKHYTHGMYVDHILFRKFLHEVDLAKESLKFYDTLDERPDATTADTESLYFVSEDGSLWYIEDGEYKIVNPVTDNNNEELFSQWLEDFISNATSIAREDLLASIDNNELIPSSSYRITNYTTTTVQTDTTSAGHDFDIIVTALSTNELSENAKCVRKSDDTYFENAKLEAWEIKYCIDNDTSRFAWADAVNGKGVIYYMKDENGNECPYDFKNIQFKKSTYFEYTFGGTTDNSLTGDCHHNTMMDYISSSVLTLNFNTLGVNSYYNRFGNDCSFNTLSNGCRSNTFGDNCDFNTFGNVCNSNTFGNGCCYNTLVYDCNSNTFGNDCGYNTVIGECGYNTFGNECGYNTFGNGCGGNTFGDNCRDNTLGYVCNSNTFGNGCSSNNFYHGTVGTTPKDYIRYIVLGDGCRNNNFYSNLTTSDNNYLQRIRIKGLDNAAPTDTQITLLNVNATYEWVVAKNSSGVIKQYCPEDRLTYKIEDTSITTWVASTKYADFGYQARIDITNLSESDFVNVAFGVNEAASGNYASAIEQYTGYILVFSKVNTAITIPTISVTKIAL